MDIKLALFLGSCVIGVVGYVETVIEDVSRKRERKELDRIYGE